MSGVQQNTSLPIAYRDDQAGLIIIKCSDLWYPNYPDEYFVIEKSDGYGYFQNMPRTYSRGEILDEFGITLTPVSKE